MCEGKTLRFIKEHEASALLSRLGIKALSSPSVGPLFQRHKMSEIVNMFLLAI